MTDSLDLEQIPKLLDDVDQGVGLVPWDKKRLETYLADVEDGPWCERIEIALPRVILLEEPIVLDVPPPAPEVVEALAGAPVKKPRSKKG